MPAIPPNMPRMRDVYYSTAAVTTAAAASLDLPEAGQYRDLAFTISGLATETVSLTGGLDMPTVNAATGALVMNTNFSAALRCYDANTGALAAASAMGNGSYVFYNFPYTTARFTKSAGVDTVTIRAVLNTP